MNTFDIVPSGQAWRLTERNPNGLKTTMIIFSTRWEARHHLLSRLADPTEEEIEGRLREEKTFVCEQNYFPLHQTQTKERRE